MAIYGADGGVVSIGVCVEFGSDFSGLGCVFNRRYLAPGSVGIVLPEPFPVRYGLFFRGQPVEGVVCVGLRCTVCRCLGGEQAVMAVGVRGGVFAFSFSFDGASESVADSYSDS